MRADRFKKLLFPFLVAAGVVACDGAPAPGDDTVEAVDSAFTSAEAVLVDFTFAGELFLEKSSHSAGGEAAAIRNQLFYTIGQLNGDRAVGRLDRLTLSNIQAETLPEGNVRVTYDAVLPVAWGNPSRIPASYTFRLPRNGGPGGYAVFTSRYGEDCVDFSAHDVSASNFWYYYRPAVRACQLAAEDVVEMVATTALSTENTTGKYPEYDRIWNDGVLEMVAIFGKYEDNATSDSDAGIAAYNSFIGRLHTELGQVAQTLKTTPEAVPRNPGVRLPDITFEATYADGRRVKVTVLLVDNVISGNPDYDFNARYSGLTPSADVILYNGHAGLGQNVRALTNKGSWVAGKYLLLFMNGCDTFAYVDGSLGAARAKINVDDPTGSRYLDIMTNALPAYFRSLPSVSLALLRGLTDLYEPKTYVEIFAGIDRVQVVAVTGEEDNTFAPTPAAAPDRWQGLDEPVVLAAGEEKIVETPVLAPGTYVFSLQGSGDADLAARADLYPNLTDYDCSSQSETSQELCVVTLAAPAPIYVLVRGKTSASDVRLTALPL